MDDIAALMLQVDWGADEALAEAPVSRLRADPVAPAVITPPAAEPARAGQAVSGTAADARARAEALAAAAETPEALLAALAAFDGCALRATAANLVFFAGNPSAELMLIGEAPGADDDRAGEPCAGPPGALLDRMLASIGLDRTQALLTTLIPWRPPGGRPPTEAEIALCLPFTLRHIALRAPRRVVLMGGLAAKVLLGRARPRRGDWVTLAVPGLADGVPALAMAHPATVAKSASQKRDAWADLRRLRRALDADRAGMNTPL